MAEGHLLPSSPLPLASVYSPRVGQAFHPIPPSAGCCPIHPSLTVSETCVARASQREWDQLSLTAIPCQMDHILISIFGAEVAQGLASTGVGDCLGRP